MHKSKPLQILKNFSVWELKDLEKFIGSEFYSGNEMLLHVFKTLKKDHPKFESPNLEKEKLFKKLFPSEPYEESKLRYIFSDLAKLIEEFIVLKELNTDPIRKKLLLLDYYRRSDLEKYFNQVFEDSVKTQLKDGVKDADWFFNQYLLEEKAYIYSQHQKSRSLDNNLQTLVNYLDLFYITNKLKHSGEMLTREMLLKVTYNKPMLDTIIGYVSSGKFEGYTAVEIYHCIVMMHASPDDEQYYKKLLSLLEIHAAEFTKEELVDMYVFAQNYCTNRINSGQAEYLAEIFNLYKKMIDLGAIYENGFVRPNVFKNIVTVGIRLEEFEWIEGFIQDYKEKLDPKTRDNAINYNMAWLEYARKEYKKALRHLSTADMMDIFYQLGAKCLLLKIYYETQDIDAFYALTESFYVYLRRNNLIADFQKEVHLNFVKYIKQLMKLRLERDKKGAKKLHEELTETKNVLDLSWFLKKLDEI
jgi:hypothetical protein